MCSSQISAIVIGNREQLLKKNVEPDRTSRSYHSITFYHHEPITYFCIPRNECKREIQFHITNTSQRSPFHNNPWKKSEISKSTVMNRLFSKSLVYFSPGYIREALQIDNPRRDYPHYSPGRAL